MFSRFAACCLVALALAPFTAPFRTCDLAMLFDGAQTQHAPVNDSRSTVAGDVNVANFAPILRPGRVRLQPIAGVAVSATPSCSSAVTFARDLAGSCLIHGGAVQPTNLRV